MKKNKAKVMDGEDFVIDAIEMKRRIEEKIYRETQGMNAEELFEHFHKRIANSEFAHFLSRSTPSAVATPADQKPQPPTG